MKTDQAVECLAHELDGLALRAMALGVPGDLALTIIQSHALGRLAGVFGAAAAASRARCAADEIEALTRQDLGSDDARRLAEARPAGRA
ncbi:MAG: hypothetical protein ACP5DC_09945 [Halothiobacillaceae bacterium]